MPLIKRLIPKQATASAGSEILTLSDSKGWLFGEAETPASKAMKISAVNRCVEIRSDAIAVLPIYFLDSNTRKRIENHPLDRLLNVRPNEAMTPYAYRKFIEVNRSLRRAGYAWIRRDRMSGEPVELIPLMDEHTWPEIDMERGKLVFKTWLPWVGKGYTIDADDMLYYPGLTSDGIHPVSIMERARLTIDTASNMEKYSNSFYAHGGRPSGVLKTATDLGGTVAAGKYAGQTKKDAVRAEWERLYSSSANAFRTAVLDNGLEYQTVTMNNSDAQFIESKELSIADIARFWGVPLHKLYTGKQSYSSNEANGIDFAVDTLTPNIKVYEDEDSYKLLTPTAIMDGVLIRRNMMAYLRGDSASRGTWYKTMREIGAYSVNDVLAYEDLPAVPGGDTRNASLNYIPLELFEELSVARNAGGETLLEGLKKWLGAAGPD